ncbi:DHHC palmitoyltransferase [Nitzschia inconspicua]|uniref:Palmitoyltransferase n=1 Tax=Nitzschia inconspicua TaxID=303405 RepID=A0A9K3K9Y3_9STRA|nr:DHHC palmitoyltransferase [Nitzschia inconspicua]
MFAMSSTSLTCLLVVYVGLCCAIMYFCLLADPYENRLAMLLQVTLPQKVWNRMLSIFGKDRMNIVQHMLDRSLVLVYFIVVGGSWSVVFWYLYPWLLFESSTNVSNVHAYLGVIVFLACFVTWGIANASHPGKITASNFVRYDHYPYDSLLFLPHKRCDTTHLPKIPRSKFDRIKYHCIVPRYDHFCGWTYNTYGEENYRWFLLFLLQHVAMCAYGTYVAYRLFHDEIQQKRLYQLTFFDRVSGETVPSSHIIVLQYMFARRPLECSVLCIMAVMGIALACFFGYHIYLTSVGQTTNENGKWADIRDWYKRQRRKYQQAVKEGKVSTAATTKTTTTSPDSTGASSIEAPPIIRNDDDVDVTCTPGQQQQKQQQQPMSSSTIIDTENLDLIDPGPVPKNKYDRGWMENWREVIFPLSLRKDAASLGGYTKIPLLPQQKQNQQKQQGTAIPAHVKQQQQQPKPKTAAPSTPKSKPKAT